VVLVANTAHLRKIVVFKAKSLFLTLESYMAWNEPGNGGKDPWGNRGNDGPPDLDEVVRNMQQKLGGLFGGKGGSGGGNSSSQGSFGLGLIAVIALIVWLLSGIYIVEAPERGVVLCFG
jgi:membrane protease subunit HflK